MKGTVEAENLRADKTCIDSGVMSESALILFKHASRNELPGQDGQRERGDRETCETRTVRTTEKGYGRQVEGALVNIGGGSTN